MRTSTRNAHKRLTCALVVVELASGTRLLVGVGVADGVTGETTAGALGRLSALKRHRRDVLLAPETTDRAGD
ncbi:hypothetical protein ABZZ80_47845 [Streptomyces sp. NPDC006356]